MSVWLIVLILFIGWLMVFLEVFIIPGTTLFGILGSLLMMAGIVMAYSSYGALWGTIALIISGLFTFLSIVLGFKTGLMNGLTLGTQNKGRVNEIDDKKIKSGDVGKAMSKIAPIGRGLFDDNSYEVQTLGEWINEGSEIEVIKVATNKIFVKEKPH